MTESLILILDVDQSTVRRASEFSLRGAKFESSDKYTEPVHIPLTIEAIWMLDKTERGWFQQIKRMRLLAQQLQIPFFSGVLHQLEGFVNPRLPLLGLKTPKPTYVAQYKITTMSIDAEPDWETQRAKIRLLDLKTDSDLWLIHNLQWPCDLDLEAERLFESYCRDFPDASIKNAQSLKVRIQRILQHAGIMPGTNKRFKYKRTG